MCLLPRSVSLHPEPMPSVLVPTFLVGKTEPFGGETRQRDSFAPPADPGHPWKEAPCASPPAASPASLPQTVVQALCLCQALSSVPGMRRRIRHGLPGETGAEANTRRTEQQEQNQK